MKVGRLSGWVWCGGPSVPSKTDSTWVSPLPSLGVTVICEAPCWPPKLHPPCPWFRQEEGKHKGSWKCHLRLSTYQPDCIRRHPGPSPRARETRHICCHEWNLILVGRWKRVDVRQAASSSAGGPQHLPSWGSGYGSRTGAQTPFKWPALHTRGIQLLFFFFFCY